MGFGMKRILWKPSVSSTLPLHQAATHATVTRFQTEEKLMSGLCTQFQSVWKPIVEKANCCNYTTIAVINVFFFWTAKIYNTRFSILSNTREYRVLLSALYSTVFFYTFLPRLRWKKKKKKKIVDGGTVFFSLKGSQKENANYGWRRRQKHAGCRLEGEWGSLDGRREAPPRISTAWRRSKNI